MIPKWMDVAYKYEGVTEFAGKDANPQILEFFDMAKNGWVKDDETPWCAAFANAVLEESGIRGTDSLAARSFLSWGKEVKKPEFGDIVVFWRGSKKGWQGHVAFFVREDKNYVWVLGGNQRNAVNVAKYPKSRVLGYRHPSKMSNSRTIMGAGGAAVSTAAKEVLDVVKEHQDTLLGVNIDIIQYFVVGLIALSIMTVVWARYDDLKKKGR